MDFGYLIVVKVFSGKRGFYIDSNLAPLDVILNVATHFRPVDDVSDHLVALGNAMVSYLHICEAGISEEWWNDDVVSF